MRRPDELSKLSYTDVPTWANEDASVIFALAAWARLAKAAPPLLSVAAAPSAP